MLGEKRARRALIARWKQPDEEIEWDGLAIWLENPRMKGQKDADGFLLLTDRRLVFGTTRLGMLVNMELNYFVAADVTEPAWNMARLVMVDKDGDRFTFWTSQQSAQMVAEAVCAATQ